MRRPKNQTTKLPKRLADELGAIGTIATIPTDHAFDTDTNTDWEKEKERKAKGQRIRAERKAQRKAERDAKKAERRRPRSERNAQKLREAAEAEKAAQATQSKSEKTDVYSFAKRKATGLGGPSPAPLKSILKKSKQPDALPVRRQVSSSREESRSHSPVPKLLKTRSAALAADDAEIATLERKLGIKKKNQKYGNGEDSFDGLLGTLDGEEEEEEDVKDKKRKREEAEEWLNQKRKKARQTRKENFMENGRESDEDDDLSESDGDLSTGTDEDVEENESEAETELGLSNSDAELASDAEADSSPPRKTRENPYVPPKVAGAEKSNGQYLPPALREVTSSEKDDLNRLHRQAQGLLNRLTEANLVSIVSNVEQLYRAHPRQHVTSVLTGILVDLICDKSSLQDTFLILHAGFITAVRRIVGADFGATVLDRVIQRFDAVREEYAPVPDQVNSGSSGEGAREMVNLVSLLAELYNLQMIGSTLIFDLVRLFLSELSEVYTELLLKIMRSMHTPNASGRDYTY